MKWFLALICLIFIGADYQKSIVRFRQTTPTGYGWQTGFAIAHEPNGSTIIATANHFQREPSSYLDVAYVGGVSSAEFIYGEAGGDIALLRIHETIPLLKINENFNNGDPVHVVGHPGGRKIQSDLFGFVLNKDKYYQTSGERIILSSPTIESGYSGAPLLNDQGEAIGLIFGGDYEGAHSVNIKHVQEMITRYCVNGCTYYAAPARVYAAPHVQKKQQFAPSRKTFVKAKPDPRIDEILLRLTKLENYPKLDPNKLVLSIVNQVVNHPNLQLKEVSDEKLKWLVQPLQNEINKIKEKISKPYFVSVEQ